MSQYVIEGLLLFVGIAISVSGWFFRKLTEELKDLHGAVVDLRVTVTGISVNAKAIEDLVKRIEKLEARS